MANPILDVVSSYSVSNGTTLTFNANLGTNLVRGSKVEIRTETGALIATHFYIPTTYDEAASRHVIPSKQALINESVAPSTWSASTTYAIDAVVKHGNETYICIKQAQGTPPNEDAESWHRISNGTTPLSVLASNFDSVYVDEAQFQYTLFTFVDIDTSGSQTTPIGLSNSSNIRSAWTLPNPTIQFNNVTSPIATTSYTVNITYDTHQTTSVNKVYNPIESIVWELYKVNGAMETLVKTSDITYNSGTQITSSTYQLNYTFNQLSNGSTYKIKCNATSILGMSASGQTIDILVDATTYQISTFGVEEDSCNGRIKITSKLVDVTGNSNVTPQGGEINLTNQGDYCTWNQGLGFTNNWTARFWAYDLQVADRIVPEQATLHFESSTTGGIIDGYVIQDPNGYRFDLYVYPSGYDGVASYFQSNVVSSLGTQAHPLCIFIGFDYDNSGTYYVKILTT